MDSLGLSPVPSDDVDVYNEEISNQSLENTKGEPQFIISVAETQNVLINLQVQK